MDNNEFNQLINVCYELAEEYPNGLVFIGGVAVYLHCINSDSTKALAEFTHDGDFYISLADMGDLRDKEEVQANRRLSKHQIRKHGFEFDIYTERQSGLIVPYDQVAAHSVQYELLSVASLEHLMVLKLEAYNDRKESAKGQKDAKDLIRLCLIAALHLNKFNKDLCLAYLREEHIALLERIRKGPEFLSLAKGNVKEAKEMRIKFEKISSIFKS